MLPHANTHTHTLRCELILRVRTTWTSNRCCTWVAPRSPPSSRASLLTRSSRSCRRVISRICLENCTSYFTRTIINVTFHSVSFARTRTATRRAPRSRRKTEREVENQTCDYVCLFAKCVWEHVVLQYEVCVYVRVGGCVCCNISSVFAALGRVGRPRENSLFWTFFVQMKGCENKWKWIWSNAILCVELGCFCYGVRAPMCGVFVSLNLKRYLRDRHRFPPLTPHNCNWWNFFCSLSRSGCPSQRKFHNFTQIFRG